MPPDSDIDWSAIAFDRRGLIPAVIQDRRSKRVLMLGYMNRLSLRKTLETGWVHFYSRSRKRLWKKGESSGHLQKLRGMQIDCDGDTLLIFVDQKVAACHENYFSCFFRTRVGKKRWAVTEKRRVR